MSKKLLRSDLDKRLREILGGLWGNILWIHSVSHPAARLLTGWSADWLTYWFTVWLAAGWLERWTPGKSISRGAAAAPVENWAYLAEGKLITIRSQRYMFWLDVSIPRLPLNADYAPAPLQTFSSGLQMRRKPGSVLFQHHNPQRVQGWKIDRRRSNGAVDFVVIKEDNDWSC